MCLATHWFRSFLNPCQRNRRLSTTPGRPQSTPKKGCTGRRESSNSWQWHRDHVVQSSANTSCTEGLGQEVKRAARQPAGSRAACTPAHSVLQAVASGIAPHQGSWAVGGGSAGGMAHATGAGCSVGVPASERAGLGTNDIVGMANCSVMQGHDTSSQPVRNMPTSTVMRLASPRRLRQHLAVTLMQHLAADSDAAEPSRNRRSRHLCIPYDKLLVVRFWLVDTIVGWSDLPGLCRASTIKGFRP
jgi:hypothetical protein